MSVTFSGELTMVTKVATDHPSRYVASYRSELFSVREKQPFESHQLGKLGLMSKLQSPAVHAEKSGFVSMGV